MSKAAIARVHEMFAIEVVAEQYVHLLKKIDGVDSTDVNGVLTDD
jgi:L-malate glycosyltransferase